MPGMIAGRRNAPQAAGARACLLRASEINRNNVEANANLGRLQPIAGKPTGAVQAWGRALQLDPTHSLARLCLSQATASGTSVE